MVKEVFSNFDLDKSVFLSGNEIMLFFSDEEYPALTTQNSLKILIIIMME